MKAIVGDIPEGVEWHRDGDNVEVTARAGRVEWRSIAGLALAAVWTLAGARWLVGAWSGVAREGFAPRSAEAVLSTLVTAAGLYGVLLVLWSMFGRERLVVRRGEWLKISNPWLFGLCSKRFGAQRVSRFEAAARACDVRSEKGSCCCGWSADGPTLTFGCGDKRIAVFLQLPPEAQARLAARLNAFMQETPDA